MCPTARWPSTRTTVWSAIARRGTDRRARAAGRRRRRCTLDADDAEADVSAAAEALGAADMGDDDARFMVDGAEDHELLWYATQEIPHLFGE